MRFGAILTAAALPFLTFNISTSVTLCDKLAGCWNNQTIYPTKNKPRRNVWQMPRKKDKWEEHMLHALIYFQELEKKSFLTFVQIAAGSAWITYTASNVTSRFAVTPSMKDSLILRKKRRRQWRETNSHRYNYESNCLPLHHSASIYFPKMW